MPKAEHKSVYNRLYRENPFIEKRKKVQVWPIASLRIQSYEKLKDKPLQKVKRRLTHILEIK
jgi:hypothetical protein